MLHVKIKYIHDNVPMAHSIALNITQVKKGSSAITDHVTFSDKNLLLYHLLTYLASSSMFIDEQISEIMTKW